MDYYPIVNISGWKYENINVSGSKEKRWYRSFDKNQLALYKLPVSMTSDNPLDEGESTGEAWSEKICSEMGNYMGFSTHQVDIGALLIDDESIEYYGLNGKNAMNGTEVYGALCWSFLDETKDSLVEGADMIMDFDETYDRDILKGKHEIYNFDLLYRLFYENGILDNLFQMIIFDTLIGNTDRHQDNFGVIRDEETGQQRFAPFYDNSSSLGREMKESRIKLMLRDEKMFNSYIYGKKSSTLIRWEDTWTKNKLNIIEFYDKVKILYPKEINRYLSNVANLTDDILENIIYKVPPIVMSETKKELVYKILKTRRDYIIK
ncbi:HipA domain-containing protein [Ureibacillus chungkukjangi]|uniref:HipA domain-containing protein n=1 Tax=Ureibacillus chungkukjangi TaxID=1202712 RepID=UPI002040C965|nr:HipA domain-containing protein [Ureibacillus chungkukjangi]MCM3389222.1 HipA domain-containing protein [Ureibacillus chungkukjangi]